ncbi:MAG: Two-component transcriptional response regulator, LuxR family [Nitrospira sp.]|nr:MAG: Two-component transcriptional response regulator, LuxR family [Nitrospira sp.]
MSGIKQEKTTTVAVLSSNYLLRLGLQKIVETETWIRLIDGHPSAGMTIDDMLTNEQPHIMIVDMEIERDVTGLVRKIKAAVPLIKIILLSGFDDADSIQQAFGRGVDGIVLKVQPSAVLIATIDYLARHADVTMPPIGKVAMPMTIANAPEPPASIAGNPDPLKWPDGLTDREREVIRLISQGLSNKDIADHLCISSITVRHHLTSIFDKLGVSNRQKLLIRAHQYGIVELTARA